MTEPPKLTGIRALAARGLLFTGAAQVWRIATGFLSTVVLARLLTPADFGLFAAASTCLAFVTLVQDLGLNQATIQRQSISPGQMSGLFWVSTATGIVLAVLVYVSAPAVAWFFGDARLEGLTMACSALVVLGAAQSLHQALLNRQMRYKVLAAIDVASVTASVASGIGVALVTRSYWSLFAAALAMVVVSCTGNCLAARWMPGRPSFQGQFSELFRLGANISGFNIVNYFSRNADSLLIGRYYGPAELGLYDRAYRLLLFPLQTVTTPLGRILFPLLSRLQAEPVRYRKAYFESTSLLMIATQPGLVFAIVFAEDVFQLLFGPHWMAAAPIFAWLGVAGLHQVMTSTLGWLFLSQARGGELFKVGLYCSIVTVISFAAGLPWGALGVAVAFTVAEYAFRLPMVWVAVGRTGPITTHDLVWMAYPHVLATIAAALALWAISWAQPYPTFIAFGALVAASYAIYLLVLVAFPDKRRMVLAYAAMGFEHTKFYWRSHQ